MTSEELIAEIQESAAGIADVSLRDGIIWLCGLARNERAHADRLFGMLQDERAVLRDVKGFAKEKIAALEKERDELRERLEQYDAEQLALVCPGCHAVAPERCAPGCIDAEMAREREGALMFGGREEEDSDRDDEGDW